MPSAALSLPQLGGGEALVEAESLSSAELSEADKASLGRAMSRARREIRRPTDLQAGLEQNGDTHFFASNPDQKLGVRFTSNGARIASKFKDRDWQVDFRLASRPPTAEVAANGLRLEYSYGSIIEWYDNRRDGIEHGFILKERPADAGAQYPVTIDPLIVLQEVKLTAADASIFNYFGESVSISGDTAVIGARRDDDNGSNSGSAYIYMFPGAPNDFDGDGESDLGVYYPSLGKWYIFSSTDGFYSDQFGYSGTIPLGSTQTQP